MGCPRRLFEEFLHVLRARAVHLEILDIISTSCIWQSLPAVFMLQYTEVVGRISCCFLRENGLASRGQFSGCSAQFALGIWTIFLEQLVRFFFFAKVTHMRHFCVFRICRGFPGQVPIFQPSSTHTCEWWRALGVPESPGVLLN